MLLALLAAAAHAEVLEGAEPVARALAADRSLRGFVFRGGFSGAAILPGLRAEAIEANFSSIAGASRNWAAPKPGTLVPRQAP